MKYEAIKKIIGLNLSDSEKVYQLFLLSLKPQMKTIFLLIPKGIDNAISAKELKLKTGLDTKIISSQVQALIKKSPIMITGTERRKKYYL